jgi:hypothetical protein
MAVKPFVYLDFLITMKDLQPDGRFTVSASGPAHVSELGTSVTEIPVFIAEQYREALSRLERRKLTPAELMELGERLAGLMLPGGVRQLYDRCLAMLPQGEGVRLRLRIEDLRLAALPWEFVWLRKSGGERTQADFLALQKRSSVTRYEVIGEPAPPLRGDKKTLKIVVVMANPDGTPALDFEPDERAIGSAIDALRATTSAVEGEVVKDATRAKLEEAVHGADVFHFAGHGEFAESDEVGPGGNFVKKGMIYLEGSDRKKDPYYAHQLAIVLGNAGVRLVVLGACNTASRDEGGAWTGVAPALVQRNLQAVVAMQYPLRDVNAEPFLTKLYQRILAGYTIDEAIFEGRIAIFNNPKGDRDWGVPVLYLRARDGILFPAPQSGASGKGPVIKGQLSLGDVETGAEATAVDVDNVYSGEVRGSVVAKTVKGKVIGVQAGNVGGHPGDSDESR